MRELNPALPPALADLVMQLLAKDPGERPPSAEAVVAALRAIEADPKRPPAARPPEPTTELLPSLPPRRRRWLAGAAALAGLAVVLVAGVLYMRQERDKAFAQWVQDTVQLPAAQKIWAVVVKLRQRNPGFDGEVRYQIEDHAVTQLSFDSDQVTDLGPLRALPALRILKCNGTEGNSRLADLGPLRDLKLETLECRGTRVADLAPLKDMKSLQVLAVS